MGSLVLALTESTEIGHSHSISGSPEIVRCAGRIVVRAGIYREPRDWPVMSVYTDGVHLVAATTEELHEFAAKIGLKRAWFQDHRIPHYDLMGGKKRMAIRAGAILVEPRQLLRMR